MTFPCPKPDELDLLLDGEVTENRGEFLRDHVRECSLCSAQLEKRRQLLADVQAPVPTIATDKLVASVLQELSQPPARSRRTSRLVWATAALASAAAALVLFLNFRSRTDVLEGEGTFAARGAHSDRLDRLDRKIGTSVYAVGKATTRVELGARVTPDTAFVLAYRNLERSKPLYLQAFAVDAQNTIHWIYPAYLTNKEDPAAVELAYAERETPLPDTVVLDHPSAGAMRFVVIVSPTHERVSSIEQLTPGDLQLPSLQRRWPEAVITELPVNVAPGEKQ